MGDYTLFRQNGLKMINTLTTQKVSYNEKHDKDLPNVSSIYQGLVVILIDVRASPINNLHPEDRKRFMTNTIDLIRYCANKNIPIINAGFPLYYEHMDDILPEIRAELNNVPKVIPCIKYRTNLFERSQATKILQDLKTHTAFVAGINATGCAYDSAVGALSVPSTIKSNKMRVATSLDVIANEMKGARLMSGCKEKYLSAGIEFYSTHKEFFDKLN